MKPLKPAVAKTKSPRLQTKKPSLQRYRFESWKEYGDIYTDSLWVIILAERKQMGINWIITVIIYRKLAAPGRTFNRYSKPGDVISICFLGPDFGHRSDESRSSLHWRRVKSLSFVEYVQAKIPAKSRRAYKNHQRRSGHEIYKKSVLENCGQWKRITVNYLFCILPIRISSNSLICLRTCRTLAAPDNFRRCFTESLPMDSICLNPVVCGADYRRQICAGELVPLGFLCMNEMNKVGFVTNRL